MELLEGGAFATTPPPHTARFLNRGILELPGEFVTREIPRISRGFFLVDRADQTDDIPCLTEPSMSRVNFFIGRCCQSYGHGPQLTRRARKSVAPMGVPMVQINIAAEGGQQVVSNA